MNHFLVLQKYFFKFPENFNLKTFKQFEDAVLCLRNRTRENAMAEMFNIELKFTVDCLKKWTDRNKVLELDEKSKKDYIQNNKPSICCICDFSMDSRASNGWFEHICKAEYLFFENLYDSKEIFRMGIFDFEIFLEKVTKILDKIDEFCESIERENLKNIFSGNDNSEIKEITEQIKKTKTHKNDDSSECSKKEVISYLYQQTIKFLPNDKIDPSFSISEKFIQNLYHIYTDKPVVHHSHITGNIIGFAHEYCNSQVRENCYNIPVIAHNQFRFDFFLFLKGLRATIWVTTDIQISGQNITDTNFAVIQNQVRFIDTTKYFQQSLADLASSMTEIEKKRKTLGKTFIINPDRKMLST